MALFLICLGGIPSAWDSGPLSLSSSPTFENVYSRGRHPSMLVPVARDMEKYVPNMPSLYPYWRHPLAEQMVLYLRAQEGVNLSPNNRGLIVGTVPNTPEPDPDRMEGLEFHGPIDGLIINDKLDAHGDVIMTDAAPIFSNTFIDDYRMTSISMDDDTSMHIGTPMDIDEPITLPPWAKDPITAAMASRPFPPMDIALPGNHLLENTNEDTTPIEACKLRQLVFDVAQLSLEGLHTKRKLKIKRLSRGLALGPRRLLSAPKAKRLVSRSRGLRYSRAAVSSTSSPQSIPLINITNPNANDTYLFDSEIL
ncbi:hypothetical protein F4814DRAFT_451008 [Daldinia grandis]|nr:hypothetical protein F4814DRAFT_451008 [Daldinia grandis]